MTRLLAADAVPPDLLDACGTEPGVLCRGVFAVTGDPDLAGNLGVWLTAPGKILLIVLLAVIVRALAHRAVNRVVSSAAEAEVPLPLRTLRGRRASTVILEATPLLSERRRQRAETVGSVLRSIVSFGVFTIAFVMVLGELGFDLAPIVASAGIVGIAVGFGAQNLVKDFLTGMFMILEDQYGVGDVIDAGPATGSVEAVGLRITRLRDVDGVVWHIRNGEITRVGNKSQGWSRAVLDVPIPWSTPVPLARSVIKSVADSVWQDPEWSERVLEEPEVWGVERLDADSLTVRLVVKTAPLEQWDVARELRERLKAAFEAAGVEVPLPQRPVAVHTVAGAAAPPSAAGGEVAGAAPVPAQEDAARR